jgi:hypothetical protein
MVKISIQAAHEQINPTDLLDDVIIIWNLNISQCKVYLPACATHIHIGKSVIVNLPTAFLKSLSFSSSIFSPIRIDDDAISESNFGSQFSQINCRKINYITPL